VVFKIRSDFQRCHRGSSTRNMGASDFFHVTATPRPYRNSKPYLAPHGVCPRIRGLNRPKSSLAATSLLERRAREDWGPDKHLDQLTPANHSLAAIQKVRNTVRGASALTATELFQAYVADKHPAPRTVSRWQGVFTALDAAGWQAPGWDAQGWLDSLKTEKHADGTPVRKPITVRDIWLGASRAVFRWAVRHKKAIHNPFAGCVVEVPRAKVTRETGRAFTEGEAVTILRAALTTPINPKQPFTAAKRWVPWIAAYTGARAGELTQLRRQDVESRPGVGWVIRITPEAGTVKTGEVRVVPLHADLVKQGFSCLGRAPAIRAALSPPTRQAFP
jgi:hypothetical protein